MVYRGRSHRQSLQSWRRVTIDICAVSRPQILSADHAPRSYWPLLLYFTHEAALKPSTDNAKPALSPSIKGCTRVRDAAYIPLVQPRTYRHHRNSGREGLEHLLISSMDMKWAEKQLLEKSLQTPSYRMNPVMAEELLSSICHVYDHQQTNRQDGVSPANRATTSLGQASPPPW